MPTYTWACPHCGDELDVFLKLREYIEDAPVYVHCGKPMERKLAPTMLMNTNDNLYRDLRASDGTDISSRAKHRAYMKARDITTIDDYRETWKRDALTRAERLDGLDPERKQDIINAVNKLGG